MLSLLLLVFPILANLATASLQIVPGASITASGTRPFSPSLLPLKLNLTPTGTNQHLQAHGGSIVAHNGLYYLIGENHFSGSAFQSINCYSSPDLVQWKFENELLSVGTSGGDLGANRVVERPHVLWNAGTGKWVMWMHIDSNSYGEAKAGVATSSTVCGDYTYL